MDSHFEHLALARWPFCVVPKRELCTFLAGRHQLRKDIGELVTTLARRETSSIHLFWSWFGAGKTHTLFYLANQADAATKADSRCALYTVYSEFPKAARGFVDLYRTFVLGIDMDTLIDAFLEISTCGEANRLQREIMLASPDLATALQVMATGRSQEQTAALRWLRADALPVSEFRRIGIFQKIASAEEGSRILGALIDLLGTAARARGRPSCRVIWLLDEFQRIERTGARIVTEISAGLHSTFNACPTGFSLFLSFTGEPQVDRLPQWFSPELRDRIGTTKVIVLPPMLADEAVEFVRDLLAHARYPDLKPPSPYYPFSKESCRAIITEIASKSQLRPRVIMHAFNAVLQEADGKLESRELAVITPDFAKRALAQYVTLDLDSGDEE
jgi:hypothetical protein